MPVHTGSRFLRNPDPTGAAAKPWLTLISSPSWHFAGNLRFLTEVRVGGGFLP